MMKLQGKTQVNRLALLFAITYMVSYITRINYGAIISEMESTTVFSRSLLSMAVTGSFITYGMGQIISGIFGDRFSPKKLISVGLCVTVLMNLIIPICQNPYQMLIVWCVNGFAQSFMWPPMVRLMTTLLTESDYKKTTTKVSWGSSIGTIIVYLISPVLISLSGWKSIFIFSAVCGAVMIVIWNKYSYEIGSQNTNAIKDSDESVKDGKKNKSTLFTPLMICVMFAIVLQGMLRDGVTTWMPSYISETYNLSSAVSILTGVILPVFSIICLQIATILYMKKFTNPLICAGIFFATGAAASLGLFFLTGFNAGFSVLLSALLTGCMHGVNLMLVCMIPAFFERYGNVSTASGVLNSFTYIGSAASTYGIALLSEKFGWNFTLFTWLGIAVAGTVICLICVKPWNRNFNGKTGN